MVNLLGIPYDANASFLRGPANAPSVIRLMEKQGSSNVYSENGTAVNRDIYHDEGDLVFAEASGADAYHIIRDGVGRSLNNGLNKTISIGGDHSITFPVMDAFAAVYPDLNILHLDAHADLYENFENNPFSHASPFARIMEKNYAQSLTQAGIRTLNQHQREQAKRYGVNVIEMRDFNFNFVSQLKGPLYISLDIDVLDPAFAPGVSHHEPGGLSVRDVITILQTIRVPIIGADIVEYNPERDINHVTAMVAYKLFKELVAAMAER